MKPETLPPIQLRLIGWLRRVLNGFQFAFPIFSEQPSFGFIEVLLAVSLLTVYSTFVIDTAWHKSVYFDEPAHILSGYEAAVHGDYRFGTSNMILSQRVAAAAFCTNDVHPIAPAIVNPMLESGNLDPWLGIVFLFQSDNPFHKILFRGRLTILCWSLIAAISVYLWSRSLFGPNGGLLSLSLLATCPTFISVGGIIGPDMPAACLFLLTVGAFWTVIHRATMMTILWFAVSSGLLLATKGSSLVFGPIAFVILFLRIVCHRTLEVRMKHNLMLISNRLSVIACLLGVFTAATLLVGAVIWMIYGFRYSLTSPDAIGRTGTNWPLGAPLTGVLGTFVELADHWHALPKAFLVDLQNLAGLAGARVAYLSGEVRTTGWRHYFLLTFLAKSHPAFLVCLGAAFWRCALTLRKPGQSGQLFQKRVHTPNDTTVNQRLSSFDGVSPRFSTSGDAFIPSRSLYDLIPVAVSACVYMMFAMSAVINIGHRHILPIYPFLFVIVGSLGTLIKPKSLFTRIAVWLVAGTSLFSAIAWHPNHLAYISPLFGGSANGYRLFADSSLEWGQELPAVKQWLDKHPSDDDHPVYFSYFGTGDILAYGIKAIPLPCFPTDVPCPRSLRPGTYLICPTMLQPIYRWDFNGSWNHRYEGKYQSLKNRCEQLFRASANSEIDIRQWMISNRPREVPEHQAHPFWIETLRSYNIARFSRLTAFLRNRRNPEGMIAETVLIYKLSETDLRQALEGPPVELSTDLFRQSK